MKYLFLVLLLSACASTPVEVKPELKVVYRPCITSLPAEPKNTVDSLSSDVGLDSFLKAALTDLTEERLYRSEIKILLEACK